VSPAQPVWAVALDGHMAATPSPASRRTGATTAHSTLCGSQRRWAGARSGAFWRDVRQKEIPLAKRGRRKARGASGVEESRATLGRQPERCL